MHGTMSDICRRLLRSPKDFSGRTFDRFVRVFPSKGETPALKSRPIRLSTVDFLQRFSSLRQLLSHMMREDSRKT
jgi:hypothetical protein